MSQHRLFFLESRWRRERTAPAIALLGATSLTASLFTGCTHTLAFSDTAPIVVMGQPPAPPPIDTEAPPEPAPKPVAAPPKVEVQQDQIVIHEKIQFESDKASIRPESSALLEEISAVIKQNPQIHRVSIEGHTDSTGSDKHNLTLSEQRAAAVRDYLVEHGIAADRLASRGWGESRPIGDNHTAAGREMNRRVEFLILEQDTGTGTEPVSPSAAAAPPAPVSSKVAVPAKGDAP